MPTSGAPGRGATRASAGRPPGVADRIRAPRLCDPKRVAERYRREHVPRFEDEGRASFGPTTGGVRRVRRFSEDRTFSESSTAWVVARKRSGLDVKQIGSGMSDETTRRGTWFLDSGNLGLRYEDGTEAEWDVYFERGGDRNVLASGRFWLRR